jgi:peptidoglycan/LPS O-acetylase OafA/YrhL
VQAVPRLTNHIDERASAKGNLRSKPVQKQDTEPDGPMLNVNAGEATKPAQPRRARKEGFNPNIHGARGLFACAVFVFHVFKSGLATFAILSSPVAGFLLGSMEFGVELFFCISGYVIVGTLRRAQSPGSFILDRVLRILPTLWVTIAIIAILGALSCSHGLGALSPPGFLVILLGNLAVLPGLVPSIPAFHPAAWSLSYEIAFYGICALCWILVAWRGSWVLWLVMPFAAIALDYYPRAIFFLSGMLTAEWLSSSEHPWPLVRRSLRWPSVWLALFFVAWREVWDLTPRDRVDTVTMLNWVHDIRLPLALFAIMAGSIGFAAIAAGTGMLGKCLRSEPLQYLGTISYSFYLWHLIVMALVKHELLVTGIARAVGPASQLLFLLSALPLSLVVAHVSQRVLERRVTLWLRSHLHHPRPLGAAAALRPAPGPKAQAQYLSSERSVPAIVITSDRAGD